MCRGSRVDGPSVSLSTHDVERAAQAATTLRSANPSVKVSRESKVTHTRLCPQLTQCVLDFRVDLSDSLSMHDVA